MTKPPRYGAISRRTFVTGISAGMALLGLPGFPLPARARVPPPAVLSGNRFDLTLGNQPVNFTGQANTALSINGATPGPILRWKEGQTVTLDIHNSLTTGSAIHWHGIRLPSTMNGFPGINFAGIQPGQHFRYRFKVQQSGTYWYQGTWGFQRQKGLYGAIVIDPEQTDPITSDRDYVVLLSDWSDENSASIYANLKKDGRYYNRRRQRTATDLWREVRNKGVEQTLRERHRWNLLGKSDRDVSDVGGYTFLINGQTPEDNWTALFKPGETVRLRFINASAMTLFDLRIPDLEMTLVAADGQNIQPLRVDEFRLGTGETYDVLVRPNSDRAYSLFAQAIDRSGYACGTLTPQLGLAAEVPSLDPIPILGKRDLGLGSISSTPASEEKTASRLAPAGLGSDSPISHPSSEKGFAVATRTQMPVNGLGDPGVGLRDHQQHYSRRVLSYADLRSLMPTSDPRDPQRELQLHLTGNQDRYMWSIDGIKFKDAYPLVFNHGERLRITLVNDTLMTQPMHLHGFWSELETGDGEYMPRKHTLMVQPSAKISYLINADTYGRWVLQCQMLYRAGGMCREVRIV
ncbi:copper resistance system multicopper oxidase [Microbulbifer variabilis]|uniref:copper resistance system multicopper oxidase n=1 Tax=Microbulbifer variabilis TaxID=266805 RepID=UPI001CFE047F|nr:copper resistance system multicopper oxidase [Microbulbifer variabilis]